MDIRRLDLNLLVVFEAMFDEGRTTKVAARLKMSQPSVSVALKKLRAAFNDDLFVREGNGMHPTPFAETLREPVKRVIQTVSSEIARDREFDPLTTRRRFTLSLSDIGELVFLPSMLAAFEKEAPNATIRCLAMPPRELEAAMADSVVDLAVGYFPDLTRGAFYQQKLFEHRFTCLVRRDHPTIGETISLEEFLRADHAVVAHEGRSQEILERRLRDLRLERRIVLQSPHFMSVPHLVATTNLITTVPRAVGRAYARIMPLRLVEPPLEIPVIELKQFWHRRVHFDLAVVWLRSLVARLYLNNDPSESDSALFGPPANMTPSLALHGWAGQSN